MQMFIVLCMHVSCVMYGNKIMHLQCILCGYIPYEVHYMTYYECNMLYYNNTLNIECIEKDLIMSSNTAEGHYNITFP